MFSLAEHILIVACIIGLGIMVYHVNNDDDKAIYFLAIPIIMMLVAKKVNNKDMK